MWRRIRIIVSAATAALLLSACSIAVPAILSGAVVALTDVLEACNQAPDGCFNEE